MWHGVTAAERADEYLDYLNRTGVPDYRETEGNPAPDSIASESSSRVPSFALFAGIFFAAGLAGTEGF